MSGATIFNIFAMFLEMIVAIRVMEESRYGLYVLIITLCNFIIMAVDFGFRTAVTQVIASSEKGRKHHVVSTSLLMRLLVLTLCSVLIMLLPELMAFLGQAREIRDYIPFIILIFITTSLDELLNSILQGYQHFHKLSLIIIIKSVLRLGISVVLLFVFKMGIHALLYSWIFSAAVSIAAQWFFIPKVHLGDVTPKLIRDLFTFGFPLHLSRILWFVANRINVVLLNNFLGSAAIAFYEVGNRIPTAFQRLSESFVKVYFPKMTEHIFNENHQQAETLFNNFTKYISLMVGLLVLTTGLFSKEIVVLVFSAKYAGSQAVLTYLMFAFHVGFVTQIIGYTLTSAGYPGLSLIENIVRAVLIVALNVILIPKFGYIGAAYAMLFANIISNPVCLVLLRKIHMSILKSKYWIHVLMLFAGLTLNQIFQLNVLLRIALILVFVVLNFVFSIIRMEELKIWWVRLRKGY